MKRTGWMVVGALAGAMLSSGCVTTNALGYIPESNFSFPNSNVSPMQSVSASTTSVAFGFIAPGLSGSTIKETIDKAKAESPGADTLLNVVGNVQLTTVPLLLIPGNIFVTTVRVQGVAAKMEVGKQELH